MMQSLNPKSETYAQGQKMLNDMIIILEREEMLKMKEDPEYVPRKKMTYEEFLDDPF